MDDLTSSQNSPADQTQRPLLRSSLGRAVWRLTRLLAMSYIAIVLAMVVFESRLVYPGAYMTIRPTQQSVQCQPWEYKAVDGTAITGRLFESPSHRSTVLFLHGNGITVDRLDSWIVQLGNSLNANVLAAEYRSFQNDDVTPHCDNLIEDALAAHDALCEHYQLSSQDLIVYGRSLGGACAAAVAARRNTQTLILDRTFGQITEVAAERFPIFPVRLLMRNRFDSISELKGFQGSVIQLHGNIDRIVPILHGKRLFDSLSTRRKQFIEVSDLRHNDPMPIATMQQIANLVRHQ